MHILEHLLRFASLVIDQLLRFGLKLYRLRFLVFLTGFSCHSEAILDELLRVLLFPYKLKLVPFVIDIHTFFGSLCTPQSLVDILLTVVDQTLDLFLLLLFHEIPELMLFGDFVIPSSIGQHLDLIVFLKIHDETGFVPICCLRVLASLAV